MAGVNRVILLGNCGRDPEFKKLDGGISVASFSLATSEVFKEKSSGEKKENVEWHNITAWRSLAESVEKSELKKGDRIYLEGKIKNKKWNDKDGNQRYGVEIEASSFTIINRKKAGATETE